MNTSEPGYVYILTNPSFRADWIKIGKTSRSVEQRINELDTTSVPKPFEIFATLKTRKYNEVERLLHKTIDRLSDFRIRPNREFFNIDPYKALDIFKDIASVIEDAEIWTAPNVMDDTENDAQGCSNGERRSRFKFSMCDIHIGDTIAFDPLGLQVKVATDDSVEFEGEVYKLSPFVRTFMPEERRNSSGAYQGAKYFSYNGQILDDIRKAREVVTESE